MEPEDEVHIKLFVSRQLRDAPDLSTLTLGILKQRYLASVDRDSLSPEAKKLMKKVLIEELMKMQDSGKDGSESETPAVMPHQKKRKREKDTEPLSSGGEADDNESKAKKLRHQSNSSEEDEKQDHKTGSEENGDEEQINKVGDDEQKVRGSQENKNGDSEEENNSEDEKSEEEMKESKKSKKGKVFSDSSSDDDQKQSVEKTKKNRVKKGQNASKGEKTSSQQDGDAEVNTEGSSSESSEDDDEKGKEEMEKKNDEDSSSLQSLEDEQENGTEKPQTGKKKKSTKTEDRKNIPKENKDDNKAVVRLKRYIYLCGVRRNFSKLLGGCRSVRAMVNTLKKELEDLGVQGAPSIKKCKEVRRLREEAKEIAELDVGNIISTQGRPKRRAALAWQGQRVPESSPYQRTLNSSCSDEDSHTGRGGRRAADWSNLQGIISDEDSD
ncbi:HIRA-interacting protein 3 isoform X2 [Myripristis murdjan]|uniref:HIRA-interacting protein 3 isoform X2 n=1 Tax=Myripristis murdjan TaxID=586833 RepID=UPI0011764793|nr:HIRA-interacting protein 3 isoform X2 [Myripristis murdjan]